MVSLPRGALPALQSRTKRDAEHALKDTATTTITTQIVSPTTSQKYNPERGDTVLSDIIGKGYTISIISPKTAPITEELNLNELICIINAKTKLKGVDIRGSTESSLTYFYSDCSGRTDRVTP